MQRVKMIECLMAGNNRTDAGIDARGQIAPLPLIELKHALDSAREGDEVDLLSDDPSMAEDIARYLKTSGHELAGTEEEGGAQRFRLRKR